MDVRPRRLDGLAECRLCLSGSEQRGVEVNAKRGYCLYREEGLHVQRVGRAKYKKLLVLAFTPWYDLKCKRFAVLLGPKFHAGSALGSYQRNRSEHLAGWRIIDLVLGLPVLLLPLLASEGKARASTDTGSGAVIWQMLVAGIVGAAFYSRKLTSWLRRKRKSSVIDLSAEDIRQDLKMLAT